MTDTLELVDQGTRMSFTFEDMLKYHGPGSPGGVAHAFKVLERALPLLGDAPPERREIVIETSFGGPGARDGVEAVTRAWTRGDRYIIEPRLTRPELGRRRQRFIFRVTYRDRSVTLVLRDGYVTDEFLDLAGQESRTPEEEAHLDQLKLEMSERVMGASAADVYDVE